MSISLIHTCGLNGANPFDYLTELQRDTGELARHPSERMPWNYRQTLARLPTSAAAQHYDVRLSGRKRSTSAGQIGARKSPQSRQLRRRDPTTFLAGLFARVSNPASAYPLILRSVFRFPA